MKYGTIGKLLSLLLAVIMLTGTMTFVASATGEGMGVNYSEEYDMTPDNLGVSYEENGIRVSYLQQFKYAEDGVGYHAGDKMPVGSSTNACHGGHHTRILRTENGTYAVVITRSVSRPNKLIDDNGNVIDQVALYGDDHPYWINGYNYYSILKLTPQGVHVIAEDICPENDSSHVPEIYAGANGHIYVIYPGEDPDTYYLRWREAYLTGDSSNFKNAGFLTLHEIDTATDTLVRRKHAVISFDTCAFDDHGYGKPSALVDLEAGKIYCIYDGGYGGNSYPAYFAWFIYDIATNEWEPTCHTMNIEHRKDYYNLYPDGQGGAVFVIQRCIVAEASPGILGFQIVSAGFAWDAVYYYHIKNMEEVSFTNTGNIFSDRQHDRAQYNYVEHLISSEPVYYPTNGQAYPISAGHYGNDGCTYRDTNGYIHIIYTESYPTDHPNKSSTTYHVIMDPSTDTETYRAKISQTLLPKNGNATGYDPKMGFTMTQGPDGKFYIFHFKERSSKVQMEIWTSPATDGKNFECVSEFQYLTLSNGNKVAGGYPIIGNSRDGSIRDGIIPMIFNSKTNAASGSGATYYYFAVEVPCDHSWGEWEQTTPPTATVAGEETRTCSFCGKTETRPVDPTGAELTLTASLSLNDSIDVNFYVDGVTAEMASSYTFKYSTDNVNYTAIPFSSGRPVEGDEDKYVFTPVTFNANQLANPVYFKVLNGAGEEQESFAYSVKAYCDAVIGSNGSDPNLKTLCSALMAYGYFAQQRFPDENNVAIVRNDYETAASAAEAVTIEQMGSYSVSVNPSKAVSASLALRSKTELSFYIKGVTSVSDVSVKIGETETPWDNFEVKTITTSKGNQKACVTVKGLNVLNLASKIKLVCDAASATYSPMAYAKSAIKNGTADAAVCKALFKYAEAAQTFFPAS